MPDKIGVEFKVNTTINGDQIRPAIAVDQQGNSLVAWQSQTGDEFTIYAQRYDNLGNPLGEEFQVNTSTSNQENPAVAMDSNGNFLIAWQSSENDDADEEDNDSGIFVQRYDNLGNLQGSLLTVTGNAFSQENNPAIATNANGNFVVAWEANGNQGGIFARRYDNGGNPQGEAFQVNTTSSPNQENVTVAIASSGDFVIAWESGGSQDGGAAGIFARRYNSAGVPVGDEFQVNTFTRSNQANPAIAIDAQGNFIITWESNSQDGSANGIFARRYNSAGAPVGDEFQANTFTRSNQENPAIAVDAQGNFIITWESNSQDGSGTGVYGQQYNNQGQPVGDEFQVNTFTPNNQSNSVVGIDGNGNFAIAWQSEGQDGDGTGIFAQRFSSTATPSPTVEFSQVTYQVNENGHLAGANIILTRTGAVAESSDVEVTIAGGSATAGVDYNSDQFPLTVRFNANETSKAIAIPILQDNIAEGTETINFALTSLANAAIGNRRQATLEILDDETPEIAINPINNLETSEAGQTAEFTVVLATQPTATVFIDLTSDDPTEGVLSQNRLIFTPENWNQAQTITIEGVDDAVVDGTIAYNIITAPAISEDPNYKGLDAENVSVRNLDNDVANVSITPAGNQPLTLVEGGTGGTYSVVLTSIPDAPVTINFGNNNQINAIAPITFNQTNWNTPQQVSVSAVDDTSIEGNHTGIITPSIQSNDPRYQNLDISPLQLNIQDNDTSPPPVNEPANVIITPAGGGGTLTLTEGGTPGNYNIVLSSAPSSPVTINFANNSQINAIAPITFNPTNWNTPQQVSVSAVDDTSIEGNHTGIITPSVQSNDPRYQNLNISPLQLNIQDNDTSPPPVNEPANVIITPAGGGGTLTLTEGGTPGNYNIVLSSAPSSPVTINFANNSQINAIAPITFNPTNWNTPQQVTVSAVDDTSIEGNHTGIITPSIQSNDPRYQNLDISPLQLNIQDNDTSPPPVNEPANVIITPAGGGGTLTLTEGGTPGNYNIVLSSAPSSPVTINFANNSQINAIAPITFNQTNWNTPQQVTVSAVDDTSIEGNHTGIITPSVQSNDPRYQNLDISPLQLNIQDNDTSPPPIPGSVTLIQPVGNTHVIEGSGSDRYKIVLDRQPISAVEIAIATDGQTTTNVQTLTFTPDNWNIAQSVNVSAVDDTLAEGPHTSIITHTATSTDPSYNQLAIAPLSVNISDNDNPGQIFNLTKSIVLGATEGDDQVAGSLGADVVHARGGNDFIQGGDSKDYLYGQLGDDAILGGDHNDVIFGGEGNDHLNGNLCDDIIYGGEGSDRIRGGTGNDQLFGDLGNDHLLGDVGSDSLTGGGGADAFTIGKGTGGMTIKTADFILDFTLNQDVIDLLNPLSFDQLLISQGTAEYATDTIIQDRNTGEYLAVLKNVTASTLDPTAFI